jgi:NADH-ubiquinone oxidoreductase chain 5
MLIIWLPLISAIIAGGLGRLVGKIGASIVAVTLMVLTWFSALYIFYEVVYNKTETFIHLWSWVLVDLGLQFDGLTAIMLMAVTSISMLVHLYSTEYMSEDPHLPRFLSYLSLFTWFMIVLVTADNYIQLFVGWEGIGLCSYLLINFWTTRIQANKSAIQAMIVNRIGDVGLVIAIGICYAQYKTLNFSIILNIAQIGEVDLIGYMLLLGAVGKSAQIGLHIWLPFAMEGPSPVSALIHACTLVVAGVYLLLRSSPILELASGVLMTITIIGAMTAFIAATIGLVQNDIKKVIAYSTCSQLGYMVFACGISAYGTSIFHLFNHAFFKALLFLSAGSVIHALGDEQDIRKMGSVLIRQPFTYTTTLIGSLSLMGLPFLTGFYSKDAIIEMAYASYSVEGTFAHWLGVISAMLTAFYSIRLINIAYLSETQGNKKTYESAHEPGLAMSIPLFILAFASILVGYIMKDVVIGPGSPYIEFPMNYNHLSIESEFIPVLIKWVPVIFSILGASYGLFAYPKSALGTSKTLYTFLNNKWHIDQVYNTFIVKPFLAFSYVITYKVLDRGLIEMIGPTGIVDSVGSISRRFSKVQSGQVYHYSISIVLGTIIMILYNVTTKRKAKTNKWQKRKRGI